MQLFICSGFNKRRQLLFIMLLYSFLWVISCNWLPIYCKSAIYTLSLFNFIHSNSFPKILPKLFYIAHSSTTKKRYGVRHSVHARSIPRRRPRFFTLPPHICSHYSTWGKTIRRRRKNYLAAWKLCGGRIVITERQQTVGGGRGWAKDLIFFPKKSQCRKLSHSAEKTLFRILIHCEITFAQHQTLSPISVHYRSYTLS